MIKIAVICGAFLLDRLAGEPPIRFHPVAWMGGYIRFFWNRRPKREPQHNRERGQKSKNEHQPRGSRPVQTILFLYGAAITTAGAVLFALPMTAVSYLTVIPRIIISLFLLSLVISVRRLIQAGLEVHAALESGDLQEARKLTSYHLVSRPVAELDEHELSAATIESLSENITDSFASPLFFYILFGLPGAWAYRFINTGDAMLGYRFDDYEWGGKAAARLDDILNFIPARITAGLIILSGLGGGVPFSKMVADTVKWRKETESPNAGWTMAAMAVLLGVRLEKRGHYSINPEKDLPKIGDIKTCIRHVFITVILLLFLFSLSVLSIMIVGLWYG